MNRITIKKVDGKGEGLFTTERILTGTALYTTCDPTVVAISSSLLSQYCNYCYSEPAPKGYGVNRSGVGELKPCGGCRGPWYCSKACQSASWASQGHKKECKIFARLPGTLPEQVRAVFNFLIRHDNDLLPEGQWEKILGAESQYDNIKRAGGDELKNLGLMAMAAHQYSKTKVSLEDVLLLMCIMKTNGLTLTTTSGDTIGVYLDPVIIKMNHSCAFNAVVYRPAACSEAGWRTNDKNLPMLKLLPLRELAADEELTITYIDFAEHVSTRQAELKERYFFHCSCEKCQKDERHEAETKKTNPEFARQCQNWRSKANKILDALKSPPFDMPGSIFALTEIVQAMEKHSSFSSIDPYHRAVHELKLLHYHKTIAADLALIYAIKQYVWVQPEIYQFPFYLTPIMYTLHLVRTLATLDDSTQPGPGRDQRLARQRKVIEDLGFKGPCWRYWRVKFSLQAWDALESSGEEDMRSLWENEWTAVGIGSEIAARQFVQDQSIAPVAEKGLEDLLKNSQDLSKLARERWHGYKE